MEESTEQIAHRLWMEAGSPQGQDLKFWLEAEKIQRYRAARNQHSPESPKKWRPTIGHGKTWAELTPKEKKEIRSEYPLWEPSDYNWRPS